MKNYNLDKKIYKQTKGDVFETGHKKGYFL